jgi:hypothetical protein
MKDMSMMPVAATTDAAGVEEEDALFGDDIKAENVTGEGQTVHAPTLTSDGRPDPQWVRGRCPECGDDLVSNMYYIGGKGYLVIWECWGSLSEQPGCTYRRVL